MFGEILNIWRKEDLLKQAMDESQEMLSRVEQMFKISLYKVMECREPEIDIYERDREVNKSEWSIRQKALEHLVLSTRKSDVPAVLILTSVVIDIERIGDYCKNIYELADICPEEYLIGNKHTDFFKKMEAQILGIFSLTSDAYANADAQKAETAMDIHWQIAKKCDSMFEFLASENKLDIKYVVIYTLLARYLKRISSHLKNIASSVINPFPKMGFRFEE